MHRKVAFQRLLDHRASLFYNVDDNRVAPFDWRALRCGPFRVEPRFCRLRMQRLAEIGRRIYLRAISAPLVSDLSSSPRSSVARILRRAVHAARRRTVL